MPNTEAMEPFQGMESSPPEPSEHSRWIDSRLYPCPRVAREDLLQARYTSASARRRRSRGCRRKYCCPRRPPHRGSPVEASSSSTAQASKGVIIRHRTGGTAHNGSRVDDDRHGAARRLVHGGEHLSPRNAAPEKPQRQHNADEQAGHNADHPSH